MAVRTDNIEPHGAVEVHGHTHHDGFDHGHSHEMSSEEKPYVDHGRGQAPVEFLVLDIGGDVGALILYADESCLGHEIDITPVGTAQSHAVHTTIRRRRTFDHEFIAGVYPELIEGRYVIWGLDGRPIGEVDIKGGSVSEFAAHAGRDRPN